MTTNTDINELARQLREAAAEVSPQNIDSAQAVSDTDGYIECPHCSGEGAVNLEADYCNYDELPIGVQFYGIGTGVGAAERYFRAVSPNNITAILDALEAAQQRIAELEASRPVVPETLPCNVLLEPGLRFGKGIKTTTLLSALARRAEYEKESANETAEQKEQRFKAFFELMELTGAQKVKRSIYDPEKWKLVPIEPTEDMIIDGFESELHEAFCSEGEWEEYEAMSGCQQAAHRARLCYAAMLAAAPALQEGE